MMSPNTPGGCRQGLQGGRAGGCPHFIPHHALGATVSLPRRTPPTLRACRTPATACTISVMILISLSASLEGSTDVIRYVYCIYMRICTYTYTNISDMAAQRHLGARPLPVPAVCCHTARPSSRRLSTRSQRTPSVMPSSRETQKGAQQANLVDV